MTPALKVYQQKESEEEKLLHLFIFVDTMLKKCPFNKSHPGPKAELTDSELITLALWRFHLGFSDWKHAYLCFLTHYDREFPNFPSYKNFLAGIQRVTIKALWILGVLMAIARKDNALLKILDSSSLPVCKNTRTGSHKVMRQFASISKTSQGWFYGLKLHLVIDAASNLLSVRITTGQFDDRATVMSMLRGLIGKFVADAGYLSEVLKTNLFRMGKVFITAVRNSMKQLMTKEQHEDLKRRQLVEVVLSQIKDRMGMASTLPRSVTGMLSHYIYTLLAYQMFRFVPVNS